MADTSAPTLPAFLEERLRHGPMPVAELMALMIGDPETGTYAARDPFGCGGDFTTAPEISQIFGELIGLAMAQGWLDQGQRLPVHLVELGPGRGTLMADLLRALRVVPPLAEAVSVHLVETSPELRRLQAATLFDHQPHWHDDLASLPTDGPLLVVANEFLDALPTVQLLWVEDGWHERCLALTEAQQLIWTSRPTSPDRSALLPNPVDQGTIVETSPARIDVARGVAQRVASQGGIAYVIDYGGMGQQGGGDTLQAVQRHRPVSVLDALTSGQPVDLSTAVDFAELRHAVAADVAVFGATPQATVLRALGIEMRATSLARAQRRTADPDAPSIMAGVRRLLDPRAMGELFKIMAMVPAAAPPPPGFPMVEVDANQRSA